MERNRQGREQKQSFKRIQTNRGTVMLPSKNKAHLEASDQAISSIASNSSPKYSRKRIMGSEQEYGILVKCRFYERAREGMCSHYGNDGCWGLKDGDRSFQRNGGFLYVDCGHPEYASPETSNPLDAVLYDKAGELLVQRKVRGNEVRLFKNNRDSQGNSFASHESYSLSRANLILADFDSIINTTLPFFISRIIFAGSGFINQRGKYEISQRAGVTKNEISGRATDSRGIFNTKDDPLMNGNKYARLHVINGDANRSEPALFLKFGTMGLVLDLFEDKKLQPFGVIDGLDAFHRISCDLSFSERYGVRFQGEMTAIEIQRVYQEAAEAAYRGRDEMTDDILNRWKFVLDSLQGNPMSLDRWLDWVIKKKLIDSYMARTGKGLNDTAVRNIDLQYHEVNRQTGLFYMLQSRGLVDRMLTDEQIEHAVEHPPEDTRARFRGAIVSRDDIPEKQIGWDYLYYSDTPDEKRRKELEKRREEGRCNCSSCIQGTGIINRKIGLGDPFDNYLGLEDRL